LTNDFLASGEYCGDMGTCPPTPQAFLTALYQKALNRAPAQTELTYWENSMSAGTTPAHVVADFIASAEFAADHGSASPTPNAASYCTGYENGIAFNPGASVATGTEARFTVTYTNYCGNTDLAGGNILIDATPSAGTTPTGGCSVEWDKSGNVTLYGASSQAQGTLAAGGVLSISAPDYSGCTVDLSNSSLANPAPGNPNATAITLAITFLTQYNQVYSGLQPVSSQTFAGTHEVYATGTSTENIATAPADLGSLTVNDGADFTFDVTPSFQTVAPGSSTVSVTFATNAIGGLTGQVGIAPVGGSCLSPYTVPNEMSVSAQATAVFDNYCSSGTVNLTMVATSAGGIVRWATVQIYFPTQTTQDFVVSVASNQGASPGVGQISYPVSVAAVSGYTSSVGLTVSGLPPGASGSFSPSAVTPGQSAILTITTNGSAAGGPYALAVTGTGQGYNLHTAAFTLPVESAVLTPVGSRTVQNNGASVNVMFNIAGSSVQPGSSCTPPGNTGVQCAVVGNNGTSVTVQIVAPLGSPHGAISLPLNGGAMPAYAEAGDTPPELYSASIPSPTWNAGITVTFSGQDLNACEDVEEGECWWTDIELVAGQSAAGAFGLSDETATSAVGLLSPNPSGGTYWFDGNACAGIVAGDGFLGNSDDSCDAGEVDVYVDPEPPPPPPTLIVTSNGSQLQPGGTVNVLPTPAMPTMTVTVANSQPGDTVQYWPPLQLAFTQVMPPQPPTASNPCTLQTQTVGWPVGPPTTYPTGQVVTWSGTPPFGNQGTISWILDGNQQQNFTFSVLGQNADYQTGGVLSALTAVTVNGTPEWFAPNAAIHETDALEFWKPGVADSTGWCWARNDGGPNLAGPPVNSPQQVGMPMYGFPGGYGMMQVDPPVQASDIWNWQQNISDWQTNLQTMAGPEAYTTLTDQSAYPFWIRQVQQWQEYNANLPGDQQVLWPGDPGPNFSANCNFAAPSLTASTVRNTGQQNTYWYGDAILMKQLGGASTQYVSWYNTDQNATPYWSFNKANSVSHDIVYEFCTCTTVNQSVPSNNCQKPQ
jgi:hypothetical protein